MGGGGGYGTLGRLKSGKPSITMAVMILFFNSVTIG